MHADLKTGTVRLESEVNGRFTRRLAAVALLVACAAAAGAQDREQLPIELQALSGLDFDSRMASSNTAAASRSRRARSASRPTAR